jgi:hypothetical protein
MHGPRDWQVDEANRHEEQNGYDRTKVDHDVTELAE